MMRPMQVLCLLVAMASQATPLDERGPETSRRARLAAVLQKTDEAIESTSVPAARARLEAIRGQALLGLGRPEEARAAFVAAVRSEAAVDLDPAQASPEALRLLDEVRRDLPATVMVAIRNGPAAVFVDDRDLGPAPFQVRLAAGVHRLRAKGPDGRQTFFQAQVSPGRRITLELEVDPPGTPRARGEPPVRRITERWAAPMMAILVLEDEAPATAHAASSSPDASRRRWALTAGVVGLALAAGGVGCGLGTLEEARAARAEIAASSAHGLHAGRAAVLAVVADVLYSAAAVSAAAAAWLFFASFGSSPAARAGSVSVLAGPTPGGLGLFVTGAF